VIIAFVQYQKSRQPFVVRLATHDYRAVAHRRMVPHLRFNLTQLDSVTPDFDLIIDPPDKLDRSVAEAAAQIARPV
jgi:hypothetical protein